MNRSSKGVTGFVLALLSGVGVAAIGAPALAQSEAPVGATNQVEEVVVTARKREESLQDVPASVQTVGEQLLQNYDLDSVSDLTNKLPNFIMPTATFTSLTDLAVRGVNAGVRNAGFNPSISFYVDGVYQGRPSNFNQILLDVERVELLLGPQGTLFGNNTIAGVVNIVTQRPGPDLGGYGRVGVGNYGLFEGQAMVNIPINDHVSTRFSALIQQRDGYQENLFTGESQGNLNRGAARWQILAQGDRTSALFALGYQRGEERSATQEYVTAGASPFPAVPPFDSGFNAAPEPFEFVQDASFGDFERFDATLTINHELNDKLSLVSITGYKDSSTFDHFDQDYAADPRLRSDVDNAEDQRLFSQELRLESNPEDRLSFITGLYYLHDEVTLDRHFFYRPPFIILGALGAMGLEIDTLSELKTDSFGAFGNVDYDILPNLELSVGLRYTAERMEAVWDQRELFLTLQQPTNVVLPLGPTGGILIANAPLYEDERSDQLWSGTATLTYHFDDARMVYARYARGTKSGGFNLEPLPNPLPTDRSFNAESLDNYEIGAKTQWWDNRFRLNVTAFLQKYHDLQRADVIPIEIAPGVTGFTRVIRNAAEVEGKGVEISAELVPVEGLVLSAAYGRANAKYTEYTTLSGVDLTGEPLTGVPSWNGLLSAEYTRIVADRFRVSGGLAAEFRGKRRLGISDTNAVEVDGYSVLNAHLDIGPDDERWLLNFWANNLTDELYVQNRGAGTDFYRAELVGYGLPRMFGVSLKVRFGD